MKSRRPVELLNFDVPKTAAQSNIAIQDFLGLDDDSQPAGLVKGSAIETLDLLNTESATPDQTWLANDAILAPYGPSNDSIISMSPALLFGGFLDIKGL